MKRCGNGMAESPSDSPPNALAALLTFSPVGELYSYWKG